MPGNRRRKALRVSAACDHCHQRRIKCCQSRDDPTRCRTCADFGLPCTYKRPRKRGRAGGEPGGARAISSRDLDADVPQDELLPPSSPPAPANIDAPSSAHEQVLGPGLAHSAPWRAFAQASAPLVTRLMKIYHETAYPIFPFFDRFHVTKRLARRDQVSSPGFFCSVMAASALASARVRDGATVLDPPPGPGREDEHLDTFAIPAETFYTAARDVLRSCDLSRAQDFDLLRGCALLAVASIQDGKIDAMHHFIGVYFTLMAIHQWHDEANWPPHMTAAEQEERRRLVSTERASIHAHCWAVADRGWRGTGRLGHVCSTGPSTPSTSTRPSSGTPVPISTKHMPGWNTRPASRAFREQREATRVPDADIYGFQMANIQATLALLQIVLFSLDGNADLNKKCTVARNVLHTFRQVPAPFLRAISTPLIYHLGGIGLILGSVVEGPLSETSYQQVRELLLKMASPLGDLEDELSPQFQLPEELLQDWTWPYDLSQACYLPSFHDSSTF